MAETDVVDATLAILKEKCPSFIFSREIHTKYLEVRQMLARASKRGTSKPGKPDIIGVSVSANVVIVVEAKVDVTHHSRGRQPSDVANYAVQGVDHYLRKMWEYRGSLGMDLVGMAVSGLTDGVPEMVTVLGVAGCNSQTPDPVVRNLGFNAIPEEERLLELLYSFRGWPGATCLPKSSGYVASLPIEAIKHLNVSFDINRVIRSSHVEEIVDHLDHLIRADLPVFLPGILILAVCRGKYYILDGQHRYKALETILNTRKVDTEILFQLVPVKTLEEAREIYRVHYLALEATAEEVEAVGESREHRLAREVCEKLTETYNQTYKIFGRSGTCPHVKLVTAVERISALLVDRPDLPRRTSDLVALVVATNQTLKKNPPTTSAAGIVYAARTMDICERSQCYLGLLRPEEWF